MVPVLDDIGGEAMEMTRHRLLEDTATPQYSDRRVHIA